MKTILFIMLPTPSHYMTTFPLAHELEYKGFNIIYTGNQDTIGNLVQNNGFLYEKMTYQTTDVISSVKYFFSLLIYNTLSKSLLLERYREFYNNVLEVKRLIEQTHADIIFIDEHLSHYYFYFKAQGCKIYLLNTKLLTSKQGDNTPLNSSHIPSKTIIPQVINAFSWIKVSLKHLLKSLKFKLAFIGKDDEFFMKRFCKKNNIDYEAYIDRQNVFYYGIKNVKRIVLAPEYLETSIKNDDNTYIFLKDKRNEELFFNEDYQQLKERITNQQNSKIILCSFGTLVSEHDKQHFLNRLNEAVRNENVLLIVVSKNMNIIAAKNENVLIYPSVPQLDLLKYCDLMIHHGGFNTIKECMQFQVPMLIYALKKKNYDWLGNAARVKWRGLVIVGDIYKDSPTKIKDDINKALCIKIPKQDFEKEYEKVNKFIEKELLSPSNALIYNE